jgi:hypothetical protein
MYSLWESSLLHLYFKCALLELGGLPCSWANVVVAINGVIATLGLSWNLSLAEDLESLSLQDGPQSGTIIYISSAPPGAKLLKLIYLSNNSLDLPQLLNLSKLKVALNKANL